MRSPDIGNNRATKVAKPTTAPNSLGAQLQVPYDSVAMSRSTTINSLTKLSFMVVLSTLCVYATPSPQKPVAGSDSGITRIESRAELVLVPVVVRDKQGNPITGLRRDQFVLTDEGSQRHLGVFEEVTTATTRPLPNHEINRFGNYLPGEQDQLRINVILIDLVSIKPVDYERTMRAVVRYLATRLDADQPTALLLLSRKGLTQIHSFTTDTRLLIESMQRTAEALGTNGWFKNYGDFSRSLNPENSVAVTPLLAEDIRQVDKSLPRAEFDPPPWFEKYKVFDVLRGMEQVAYGYAGLPGRKSLIWITANVPFDIPDDAQWKTMGNDMVAHYENIWRVLNSANMAVYPLDVNGLVAASTGENAKDPLRVESGFSKIAPAMPDTPTLDRQRNYRDTYLAFANATGGKPCVSNNDIDNCLELATRDSEAYYVLGFYLKPEDRNVRWHRLHVELNVPHGDLRCRAGYFLDTKEPGKRDAARGEIGVAYHSPIDYTALPIDVAIGKVTPVEGRRKLTFTVGLPAGSFYIDSAKDNYVQVNILAVALNEKGKVVAAFNKTIRGSLKSETASELAKTGFNHLDNLQLAPGRYQLKLVVRDDLTRRMGSVTIPLEVR